MNSPTPGPWPDISPAHQQQLAQLAARYVRWPHPDLVAQVAEANAAPAWQAECRAGLEAADIDPALYLWLGSTCLFPGIRRFKNSRNPVERANSRCAPGALVLDRTTNHSATAVWKLLVPDFEKMRGDYHLVHLFPHQGQEVKKIVRKEHVAATTPASLVNDATTIGLPGLFTSAANMCYMPSGLTRPTDADSLFRQVLWRQALALYGLDFLPPLLRPAADALPAGSLSGLTWDAPVFGAPLPTVRWQQLAHTRQQWFRQELAAWQAARPGCA